MNNPNAFWEDLLSYLLIPNQGLALFRQNETLSRHKSLHILHKYIVIGHWINAWLHFTNNKFPLTKEILNETVFLILKQNSTLAQPDKLYILPCNTITSKCTSIRDILKFFLPDFLSYTRFPLPTLAGLTSISCL